MNLAWGVEDCQPRDYSCLPFVSAPPSNPGRDHEGWKVQGQVAAHLGIDLSPSCHLPVQVFGAPRLQSDLESLLRLMSSPLHPNVSLDLPQL
jgi:hypothetical protein